MMVVVNGHNFDDNDDYCFDESLNLHKILLIDLLTLYPVPCAKSIFFKGFEEGIVSYLFKTGKRDCSVIWTWATENKPEFGAG